MGLDLQLYAASCGDATLASLAAVGDSSLRVQDRPDPRIVDAFMHSANVQYGWINAPSLPQMGLCVSVPEQISFLRYLNSMGIKGVALKGNDALNPQGYQDSGGAETVYMGLLLGYGPSIPYRAGRLCSQRLSTTSGNAAWGTALAFTASDLDPTKRYQILGYYMNSTAGIACRFEHADFLGLKPGLHAVGTDVKQNKFVWFPKEDLPTFKGSNPCTCATFGDGNAIIVEVLLNEIQ